MNMIRKGQIEGVEKGAMQARLRHGTGIIDRYHLILSNQLNG